VRNPGERSGAAVDAAESSGWVRFGTELRAHRTAKGWTQVQFGKEIGYSGSFVSDVERGDRGVVEEFAKASDDAFGAPGTFVRLWEDAQKSLFPVWFAPVIPIEREAEKIAGWELGSVPGLLQTEAYASAVAKARKPQDDEEAIERIVQARMDRQGILSRPKPPMLWYIIHEGVLRQCTGGAEVMAAQLERLIKAAESPGIVIQVLPFSAQANAGVDGLLYLYERTGQLEVAYCETYGGARVINDATEVSDLATVMGMLRAAASPPWDSVALLRQIRRDLD
jgi:transcriptional regulator with XRE-family HTH domain